MPIDIIPIGLELFAPRSRIACCGTCDAWREQRPAHSRTSYPYCPRINTFLRDFNLTAIGCQLWRQEPHETFAVELYQELVQEGAT